MTFFWSEAVTAERGEGEALGLLDLHPPTPVVLGGQMTDCQISLKGTALFVQNNVLILTDCCLFG